MSAALTGEMVVMVWTVVHLDDSCGGNRVGDGEL